jgi:hypothetical protein
MIKPMIVVSSFLCISLSTICGRAAELKEKGWVEVRCAAYRGDYCRIPFSVAQARVSELVSQVVRVQLRGYLVREPEGFALYANKDSAKLGWRSDAFLIELPASAEIRESLARWNQSLVQIRGQLVLDASDHDEYWAALTLNEPVTVAGVRGEQLRH